MTLLDFRKPDLTVIDKFVSHTGKYWCFYGIHYVKGKPCYDVGSSNKATGEIVRRHYHDDNNIAPEASAKTYWEDLKQKMLAKLPFEAEPSQLDQYEQWLDINQPNWRKDAPKVRKKGPSVTEN